MLHLSMRLFISKYCILDVLPPIDFFSLFSHSPSFEKKSLLSYMGKRRICGIYHYTLANEHRRKRKGRTIDMASALKPFSVDGGKEGGREAPSLKEVWSHFNRSILSSTCPFIQVLGRQAQILDVLCL